MKDFAIFAGSAIPELATAIARELGLRLGACAVERFPDGESWVGLDEPVRGRDVFIVQSTSAPVNESLVELLAFAVLVTDTISVAGQGWEELKVVSVAPLIASAIRRFAADGSIRDLY